MSFGGCYKYQVLIIPYKFSHIFDSHEIFSSANTKGNIENEKNVYYPFWSILAIIVERKPYAQRRGLKFGVLQRTFTDTRWKKSDGIKKNNYHNDGKQVSHDGKQV